MDEFVPIKRIPTEVYGRRRVPRYAQVASVMRQRVRSGGWLGGADVPTLDDLRDEFSVREATIRQALVILREEGLLEERRGRCVYATRPRRQPVLLDLTSDLPTVARVFAHAEVQRLATDLDAKAPRLRKAEGTPAAGYVALHNRYFGDDEAPFAVAAIHLSSSIYQDLSERFAHAAVLPHLLGTGGLRLESAMQTLTIATASPALSQLLRTNRGEPIVHSSMVIHDVHDVAIYVAEVDYRRECFAFRSDLIKTPRLLH